jgi:hypothetical protein
MCNSTHHWFQPGQGLTAAMIAQHFYETLINGIERQ